MRHAVQKRLAKLNAETEGILQLLVNLPPETLHWMPSASGWSALQVVNHIYLSEKLSFDYVSRKIAEGATFPDVKAVSWFRSKGLTFTLASPLKVKSPKPVNMRDGQAVLPVQDLRPVWQDLRFKLLDFLETHEADLRRKMPYKHPYVGPLTLCQMLTFFRDHQRHHRRQIRRILAMASRPGTLAAQ